jgi:hypothetical protein
LNFTLFLLRHAPLEFGVLAAPLEVTMSERSPSTGLISLALLLLFVTALVHYLAIPDKLGETKSLGWGYILLVAGCSAAGAWLLSDRWRLGYILGALVCGGALVAFTLTRTVGLLGSSKDDIGNWGEPAGLISLAVEAAFVILALSQLGAQRRAALR